jgi:hypothetical protein
MVGVMFDEIITHPVEHGTCHLGTSRVIQEDGVASECRELGSYGSQVKWHGIAIVIEVSY